MEKISEKHDQSHYKILQMRETRSTTTPKRNKSSLKRYGHVKRKNNVQLSRKELG